MKRILDLIRVDLISFSGKKKGILIAFVTALMISILIGIFILPEFMAVCVLVAACLMTSLLTSQENQLNTAKIFCILPTDRKSIVLAKYLLTTVMMTGISLLIYILMEIAMEIDIYDSFTGGIDTALTTAEKQADISLSVIAVYNAIYSFIFMISMIIMSGSLRRYFKNGISDKKNSLIRTTVKIILIILGIVLIETVLFQLVQIQLVQSILILIFSLLEILAQPLQGLLLSMIFIGIGYGMTAYHTVCSVLEYDEREL